MRLTRPSLAGLTFVPAPCRGGRGSGRAGAPGSAGASPSRPYAMQLFAALALVALLGGCQRGSAVIVKPGTPQAARLDDEPERDGLTPAQRRGRRIYLQGT